MQSQAAHGRQQSLHGRPPTDLARIADFTAGLQRGWQQGAVAQADNLARNAVIAPGASQTFGFIGRGRGYEAAARR
jgi:hypothetical protein